MRGYITSGVSILAVLVFCVCLFMAKNLSIFWLFLELATLSLIPSFFLSRDSNCLDSLFSYLVVSAISSSFIVCGLLFEGLLSFLFLGFLIKFGIFPFFGWVYKVVTGSNWVVVWGFSTLLKSPFLFMCYFLSSAGWGGLNILVALTLLLTSVLFWVYSYSWFHCWCHMMLSSSAGLVAMSVSLSADSLLYLFFVYVFWSSLVIVFLSDFSEMGLGGVGGLFYFCVLLVSVPCSISVFYKLLMGMCIYSCFFPVFLCWVLYSVSEQFYLIKFLVDTRVPRGEANSLSLI